MQWFKYLGRKRFYCKIFDFGCGTLRDAEERIGKCLIIVPFLPRPNY